MCTLEIFKSRLFVNSKKSFVATKISSSVIFSCLFSSSFSGTAASIDFSRCSCCCCVHFDGGRNWSCSVGGGVLNWFGRVEETLFVGVTWIGC